MKFLCRFGLHRWVLMGITCYRGTFHVMCREAYECLRCEGITHLDYVDDVM